MMEIEKESSDEIKRNRRAWKRKAPSILGRNRRWKIEIESSDEIKKESKEQCYYTALLLLNP
jgi:hypothetical protein